MLEEEKKYHDLKNEDRLIQMESENPVELKQLKNAITLSKPLLVKQHPFSRVKDQSHFAISMQDALKRWENNLAA